MTLAVSIVVPARDEADDIGETLDAIEAQDYDRLEAIVVDASRDRTPDVVRAHRSLRIRLIRQSRGRGRSAARNEGILAATGDVVVVLNADVRLPQTFVRSILRHYEAGADYVLVESRVSNLQSAFARYAQALHTTLYPPRADVEASMNWTEGFSCRRAAALAVGLFPEGAGTTIVAGEDGWFGEKLAAAGYRKAFDRSVIVTHVAPADLASFWRQRLGRGRGWPQILAERHGWTGRQLAWLAVKVAAVRALPVFVLVPSLWRGWVLAGHSVRGRADWLPMAALDSIDSLATVAGVLAGARELRRSGRA
jgi:glycosyltransferase involved in cell wall biosynthesis